MQMRRKREEAISIIKNLFKLEAIEKVGDESLGN